jgi:hypothetical protein
MSSSGKGQSKPDRAEQIEQEIRGIKPIRRLT